MQHCILYNARKGCKTFEYSSLKSLLRIVFKGKTPRREVYNALGSLVHFEKNHGSKAMVNYLKDLKLKILDGVPFKTRSIKSPFLRLLKKLDKLDQLRLVNICTRWEDHSPSAGMAFKFSKTVSKKFDRSLLNKLPDAFDGTMYEQSFIEGISLGRLSYAPLKSAGSHYLFNNRTHRGPMHIYDEALTVASCTSIFRNHKEYLKQVFKWNSVHLAHLEDMQCKIGNDVPIIGRITPLQCDGALKHRWIANVAKGWQVGISPLVNVYKYVLKNDPICASYNQLGAAECARKALEEGNLLSSFDIVDSTNNIPVDLFFKLFNNLVYNLPDTPQANLIRNAYFLDQELCQKGEYLTKEGILVKYNTGQGMGRWTSKAQLDLTNIALLRASGGDSSNCRVNGDDVIIWNESVSNAYKKICGDLEIPLHEHKSFELKDYGEFSGRLIYPNAFGHASLLPIYKGRKLKFKKDPFGSLRQYGALGLNLVPAKQRRVIERIANKLKSDTTLDEFRRTHVPIEVSSVTEADLTKKISDIEKQKFDPNWVKQVFNEEASMIQATQKRRDPFGMSAMSASVKQIGTTSVGPGSQYQKDRERVRGLTCFKDATLQQFKEPNKNLDLLVDHINAENVILSDGGRLEGWGENSPFERLRRDPDNGLNRYSHSQDIDPRGNNRLTSVYRMHAEFKKLNKQYISIEPKRKLSVIGQTLLHWLRIVGLRD
jgi:hypothetical protein